MCSSGLVLIGRGLDHTHTHTHACARCPLCASQPANNPPPTRPDPTTTKQGFSKKRHGGHSGGETPGPIPNPEAKPSSADGTAPETVWESRTPPDNNPRLRPPHGAASTAFLTQFPSAAQFLRLNSGYLRWMAARRVRS